MTTHVLVSCKVDAGLPNLNTDEEALRDGGGVVGSVGGGGGATVAETVGFF